MPAFLLIAFLTILAGCVTAPSSSSLEPTYNKNANAIVAEGYPISPLFLPDGFDIVGYPKTETHSGFAMSDGKERALEVLYMKQKGELTSGPLLRKGFLSESFRGRKIYYDYFRGIFEEMISAPNFAPRNAPDCARAVTTILGSQETQRIMVVSYIEGHDCSTLSDFNTYDKVELRHNAYELMGLWW